MYSNPKAKVVKLAARMIRGRSDYFCPANAITLSCKDRLPCRPPTDGAAAAATNAQRRERAAADVTPACSSEPPEAAPPPSQGSAVFVSL